MSIGTPKVEEQIALIEYPMKPIRTARRHDHRDGRSRMAIGPCLHEAFDRVMADTTVLEKMQPNGAGK